MRTVKTITVFFCLMLVASPVVFNLAFQLQTISVKKEMKQRLRKLEREQLITLHLKSSDIHWYKKGKELQIGSELFDVKSITPVEDGYMVTGLFDKKEKELKQALEQLSHKERKQQSQKMISFLQLIYHPPAELSAECFPDAAKEVYPAYAETLSYGTSPIILPPPKSPLAS